MWVLKGCMQGQPLMFLLAFIQFVFLVVKGSKLETYSRTTKALKYLFLFLNTLFYPSLTLKNSDSQCSVNREKNYEQITITYKIVIKITMKLDSKK